MRAPREDPRRADRPALRVRPQAGRGSAHAGDHRPVGLGRAYGVDGDARVPAGSTAGRPRSRSSCKRSTCRVASRAIVAIARDVRERIEVQVRLQRLAEAEHARAAELNAVIRAMGEAVVVCAADGTITLTNPAGEDLFPDVEERDVRRDPRRSSTTRSGSAPPLGARGGPVELQTRDDPGSLDRALDLPGQRRRRESRRAAARRSSSCATSPRRAVARRSARRSSASCRTSCGPRSRRSSAARSCWPARARPSTRRRRRGIFRDIHEEAERLQRLVEDVVALNRFGDEAGDVGAEPVLLQRLHPARRRLRGGPLAGRHVRDRGRTGAADGHRRPDLRRAGRAQPAVECGEVRRRRLDRRRSSPRPRRRTRSSSASSTTARASRPRRRTACSSCSTARPAPPRTAIRRRDRAVRVRPPHRRDGRPHLGGAARATAARSSGSPCGARRD